MSRSTASALCLALGLLACGGWSSADAADAFATISTPRQSLRTCVDRWNQGNMRSWPSMSVNVAIRALSPQERSVLLFPDAAQRRCTVSLASRPGRNSWICRIDTAGAYECPLVTSDGMPALRAPNGKTDRRGILTIDVPLQGTHATPPLPWQRRYPHVDGFVLPWTAGGTLRSRLRFDRAAGARHYRGTCGTGSQRTVAKAALRCFSDVQFDPCFAPSADWNHPGATVACARPGGTSFARFLIVRRS